MHLKTHRRIREGVTILDLDGRITAGEDAAQLRECLREIGGEGVRQVILNLQNVDYIDSTGLGTLVVCFTSFAKLGGTLKLTNLSRRTIELLVLTKLTTIFEIFAGEQDAVNSFFPGREIKRFDILNFIQEQEKER
ncbi:MAG: STAS domain-containing protein [Bryobacteraceae bacterium]